MGPYEEKREEQQEEEEGRSDPDKWDTAAVEGLGGGHFGYTGGAGRRMMMACGAGPPPMPMARMAAMPCAAPMAAAAFAPAPIMAAAKMAAGGGPIGFKTGGAQDAANFRQNIQQGHLPAPTDVTYEGVAKDYYFDTASSDAPPCDALFCPAYSLSLSPDPLAAAGGAAASAGAVGAAPPPPDMFVAVGLDSGLTDFRRPRLNLVLLLDVSGSMQAQFDRYHYGASGGTPGAAAGEQGAEAERHATKLDVAKEVIKGMLGRLGPDDSVAICLFSDSAATPKKLGRWGTADAAGIAAGIDALHTVGGTNFQAGLDEATKALRGYGPALDGFDPATTENRIIVLTDAQPNAGEISEEALLARLKANTADRCYMTLVGVGLDFNTELVEKIMKVRGANYFSVHTPGEFRRRLDSEFDFMVAPLVFDLELRVDPASLAQQAQQDQVQQAQQQAQAQAQQGEAGASASGTPAPAAAAGWRVLAVYGSPDAEERRLSGGGSIMRVHTLFPSPKTEAGIKGGVVLLRVAPPPGATPATAPPLRLAARYVDRAGKQYESVRSVAVPPEAADVAGDAAEGPTALYQSSGVRKAVLLARLTDALQSWLLDEWSGATAAAGPDGWDASVVPGMGRPPQPPLAPAQPVPAGQPVQQPRLRLGCPLLPPPQLQPGRWERQSRPLAVGPAARAALRHLLVHVEAEVAALGDRELQQEVDLLHTLTA